MNPSIQRLSDIASKPRRKILGLMSGTSLDGLDIALCEIEGAGEETRVKVVKFTTFAYPQDIITRLKKVVSVDTVSLEEVCLANTWMADYHSNLVLETLSNWNIEPSGIDCIASHGQTIYHAPYIKHKQKGLPDATLQIGDGDHIARKTGIMTISDFRQKHTAAGGEGAPIVSVVDRLLFTDPIENRFLLNIGGIANFSFLPSDQSATEYLTTDTGPGNILINTVVQQYYDMDFDHDGAIAASGNINPKLLNEMKREEYFMKPPPKTTGPEVFNEGWIERMKETAGIDDIDPKDLISTLTWLTAETIADPLRMILDQLEDDGSTVVYLSGGGIHNQTLVNWLGKLLENVDLKNFEVIGYNPDAKEAASFAVLANETLAGKGFLIDPKQGAERRVNFGKISFPL